MNNLMLADNLTKTRMESFSSLKNQRGSAAVDYAVILVFVVLVVMVVIASLEQNSIDIFTALVPTEPGKIGINNFGSIPKE